MRYKPYYCSPETITHQYVAVQDSTPPGTNFRPGFLRHMGHTHTQQKNVGFGKKIRREILHRRISLVVISTPSPLSRNPDLKIVRGGVLSYHPSVIVFYRIRILLTGSFSL